MSSEHAATAPSCETHSIASRPDLLDPHQTLGGSAWPTFMLNDPVAMAHWGTVVEHFADCQLSLVSGGEIVAVVNTVPLRFDGLPEDLPDRGVGWGVEKSVHDHERGIAPNALMGMQIVVAEAHRGKGLSAVAVAGMIALARRRGLGRVILPVRPTRKHRFPLIPMERYVEWRDETGLPYDPWLRVHARLGGRIVRICPRSMIIPGTVQDWSGWTGMTFPGSGDYIVPGALNPVGIDIERDCGLYREPNVWVVHETG